MDKIQNLLAGILGRQGQNITKAGIFGGSFAGPTGPLPAGIGGGSEALRQTLFDGPDKLKRILPQVLGITNPMAGYTPEDLKKIAQAGGSAEAGALTGAALKFLFKPIAGLSKMLEAGLAKSSRVVSESDLIKAINTKVAPAISKFPGEEAGKKTLLNNLKANLPQFLKGGGINADDISGTNVNELRRTVGTLSKFKPGNAADTIQKAGFQEYYRVLRDALTKADPVQLPGGVTPTGLNLGAQSVLSNTGDFASAIPGVGPFVSKLGGAATTGLSAISRPLAGAGAAAFGAPTPGGQPPAPETQNSSMQSGTTGSPVTMGQQPLPQVANQSTAPLLTGTPGQLDTASLPADHFSPNKDWVFDPSQEKWVTNPDKAQETTMAEGDEAAQLFEMAKELALQGNAKGSDQLIQLATLALKINKKDKIDPKAKAGLAIHTEVEKVGDEIKGRTGTSEALSVYGKLNAPTGIGKMFIRGKEETDLADLESKYFALTQAAVTAVQGSRPSDFDTKAYQKSIGPSIMNPPELNKARMITILSLLEGITISPDTESSALPDLATP